MVGTTLGLQNQTELQTYYYTEPRDQTANIVSVCLMMVIFVTGVIGNGLVIFVIGYKMKTTVNSIWFLNLAITDFIFIPILVYIIVVIFDSKVSENILLYECGYFIFVLNMFASAFFLTVISLDRCMCTWCVVWAQNKRTLVKARIICVFVWLLAICCSIPFAVSIFQPRFFTQIYTNYTSLSIYMFTVGFLIPFLIITSSYIAIGVRIRRFPRRNQLRIFRVIFVILAFFISWFPFHFQQLFIDFAHYNDWDSRVLHIFYEASVFIIGLVFLSSSLNPILYVFMCDEYKKKLKTSLLLVFEGAFTEDHLGLH
ncbi:C3a anaphylatoxin chemotactic receptor-like [Triplophysa dalaica]|uniref:C3a anaphylatoxin chemotactic receptor-like n=1 Tax=Triplophysa dalaica TaxID=1582913 RepID=UPI0024DFC547|nr:C3a anaphylatoxin chemotactic receptor-like [Triplophysa dalaica]